ncbi:MAG: hypothetical protein NC905_07795, partial [Candidatus Omnitrophica bacterium]|nr:hypothetical protein [Candidatus Omnitrophota bacterium]
MKRILYGIVLCAALTPLIFFIVGDPTGLPKFVWIFFTTVLLFWLGIKERLFGYCNTFILPV